MALWGRKEENRFVTFNIDKRSKDGLIDINEKTSLSESSYETVQDTEINIDTLISIKGKRGEYAKSVIKKIISYANFLVPSVTNNENNIDEAMRLGFNWTIGPFEMQKYKNNESRESQVYLDSEINTLRRMKSKKNYLIKDKPSAKNYFYKPKDYNTTTIRISRE